MGVVAERYIKEAKERIAKTLKADEKRNPFLPKKSNPIEGPFSLKSKISYS